MNKQIEDMIKAFDDYCNNEVPDDVCARTRCIDCHAKSLINAGYRKASDVAMEIVNEVKETLLDFHLREDKKYRASKAKSRKQFEIETARYRAITDAIKFAIETLNEIEKKHESEGGE